MKRQQHKKRRIIFSYSFLGTIILLLILAKVASGIEKDGLLENTTQSSKTKEVTKKQSSTKNKVIISETLTTSSQTTESTTEEQKFEKAISLTFDDGPSSVTTPKILDTLKSENVTATFFLLGQNVSGSEQIVKQIKNEGHEIGSHSQSHPLLTSLDEASLKSEFSKSDTAIKNATGEKPRYVRPPYGAAKKREAEIINRPLIEWSVDSLDWQSKNKAAIIQQVVANTYPGSIILMHDIQPATAEALPDIIKQLKEQEYQFVSISELLDNPTDIVHYFGANDHKIVD